MKYDFTPKKTSRKEALRDMLHSRLVYWTGYTRTALQAGDADQEELLFCSDMLSRCLTEYSLSRVYMWPNEKETYAERAAEAVSKQLGELLKDYMLESMT